MPADPPAAADAPLLTLADWQQAYLAGGTVRALAGARLTRLARQSESDPAWIAPPPADAMACADRLSALDAALAAAPDRRAFLAARPLFGVPFAVKDNIDAAGWVTTAACPAYARRATRDATVVRRLLDAGAVLAGKTNLDQFATGLVGTRSPYGQPASTFDGTRVSGGSSSGSAVLVSRGDLPFALGTDTAGSGRVPAAFNHIVGLKPTPGRIGTAGVVPACRSIDCVSVFALTVDDAVAVAAVLEGPDDDDPYSDFHPGAPRAARPGPLRIGVPHAPTLDRALGYPTAWSQVLDRLASEGAEIVPLDFGLLHEVAALLYDGPWVAERHAAARAQMEGPAAAMDPTVRAVIEHANRFSAADAFRGQYTLQALRRRCEPWWQQVDLLLVPSAPGHPTHAEVAADPVGANAALGTYTNFVNLLGWCALAVPAALTAGGLPFGVTAIGPAGADAALAEWARGWEASARQRLGATDRAAPGTRLLTLPALATPPAAPLAVVGAHLSGLPLNVQLTERGGRLLETTRTAPRYRLHALPGSTPPKPGLQRMAQGGAAIEVEVWSLPLAQWGSFMAGIPAPLGIGRIELADGRWVHGFLCEPHALADAPDISHHGGWRRYLASPLVAAQAPTA